MKTQQIVDPFNVFAKRISFYPVYACYTMSNNCVLAVVVTAVNVAVTTAAGAA